MRALIIFLFSGFLCSFLLSCGAKRQSLAAYFPNLPLADTLRFAIAGHEEPIAADTVPNDLFFGSLPVEMYADIEYVADTSSAIVLGRGRFRLDKRWEAYWVDIRYAWFQHQSLLLYDTREKRFSDRITAAEWYGGEGGQILIGSWLLKRDGGRSLELVQRQDDYSIRFMDDAVLQDTVKYVSLWQRHEGVFVEQPVRDSLGLIHEFSLER